MSVSRTCSLGAHVLALLAVCCPRPAVGAQPAPAEIKKQYWQALPGVDYVYKDARGDAWLATYAKCSIEESYRRALKLMPAGESLLLGDRAGRLWFNKPWRGTDPTRCYDGKAWQTLPFRAVDGFEDPDGRVILVGPNHFHVLHNGRWTKERYGDARQTRGWRIVRDPADRTWIWAATGRPPARLAGAWCFDAGKWKRYTTANGFPTDAPSHIVPLTGGRFLVTYTERTSTHKYAVWGGPKNPAAPNQEFVPGYSVRGGVSYLGTDTDGNHYCRIRSLLKAGQRVPAARMRMPIACFTPEGAGHLLTLDGRRFLSGIPRGYHHGRTRLYFVAKDRWTDETDIVHRPPAGASVFCVDRLGRIFFRGHVSTVQVIWPKHERPGDLIRAHRPHELGQGTAFQGPGGDIWFKGAGRLLHWSGKKWEPTPVVCKPHPPWSAHPAPPWNQISRPLHVQPGRNGSLLAVNVRDIYQVDGAQAKKEVSWRDVVQRGQNAIKAGKRVYWLEGWLRKAGKWIGPTKIDELIKAERTTLLKDFTVQTHGPSYFDLQSDGKHVWVAFDGKVRAVSSSGALKTWEIPKEKRPRPLANVNLACMPGGTTWCVYQAERASGVMSLSVAKGVTAVPAAAADRDLNLKQLHVSRAGRLWRWHENPRHGWRYQGGVAVWDGKAWQGHKALAGLLFEDGDGLWFLNQSGRAADRGLHVIRKSGVTRLPWSPHLVPGMVSKVGPRRCIAACSQYLVSIVPVDGRPGSWKTGRVQLLSGMLEHGRVFLDGRGNIIGESGWWGSFPGGGSDRAKGQP